MATLPSPAPPPLSLEEARALWHPAGPYLNTASYGLPPDPAWEALQAALSDWRGGRTSWEPWGDSAERARGSFARLVGVEAGDVAIGANVSAFTGLVAAALPAGARVLVPAGDFTSSSWPYAARGDLEVTEVPRARLAEALDARTDVVAFSAADSATGELADLPAIAEAARHHDVLTVVDATQACGWLPLGATAFDVLTCGAYKWLMSPRGTAFMTVRPDRLGMLTPLLAGWYAGEDVHESYYGLPLRLARSARRLDVSPAWFSWVGCAPALELLERIGIDAVHAHDVGLADRLREALGLAPTGSAIVCLAGVPERAAARLRDAGVQFASRAGGLRLAWHLYSSEEDLEVVLGALGA
jgi:selenocysteine lyase/cysteine desulfurase